MALTTQDIENISQLARIHVSEGERDRLLRDLNRILGYVEELREVDIEGVLETFHPTRQESVLREDLAGLSLTQEEALMNAPDKKDGYFRVPKVIG